MSTVPAKLTTTSYAILGLLAIQSWTTYELIRQVGRGVDRFWPRSRSRLFEEPKKLVAHGLATAIPGTVGRRPRTQYTITDRGRHALAAWLATPSHPPAMECEHLVKVFFAEHGTRDDLLSTIAGLRAWADQDLVLHSTIARAYLASLGPFPQRLPVNTLTGRYLADIADTTRRWADWATALVDSWPEEIGDAEPDRDTLNAIADMAQPRRPPVPPPAFEP
jgi:DNA-binding PadR family transcriptional regulator